MIEKCCWDLYLILLSILGGRITYLHVSIEWVQVFVKVEETPAHEPQEDLHNIKAQVVKVFFYLKSIQIYLFFSLNCLFMVYFINSLIIMMSMIYNNVYTGAL